MIFVGRQEELNKIHRSIAERNRSIICIRGRSKMGKTLLVEKILEELADRPHLFGTIHKFHSPHEDVIFPFVASLGELVRQSTTKDGAGDKARRLVRALAAEPQKTALRMAGAAYRAARAGFLNKVKEYFQYEEIVDEAVSILEEKLQQTVETAGLDKLLAESRPAVITSYLGLLENLSDHADPEDRYVFIFDQLEHAPAGGLEFLMTLIRALPPQCYLLFSLNIEHPRGGRNLARETY